MTDLDVTDELRVRSTSFAFTAENRLASDRPLPGGLDLSSFMPRLITLLSNVFSLRESQSLRQQFDLGTTDWRIIGALAQEPALTATELSKFTVMSKAVISRKLSGLVENGLIEQGDGPRGSRPLRLTDRGAAVYRGMLPIAFRGQRLIERTLTAAEVETLESLLTKLLDATTDEEAWSD